MIAKRKHSNGIARDRSEKIVTAIAEVMAVFFSLLALLPVLHVFSTAISRGTAEVAGRVYFWPVDPQLDGIRTILFQTDFLTALVNTIFVTLFGTAVSMIITILFAYPMSRYHLKGRKFLTLLCMVSMVFNGGMIPTYLIMRSMNLLNNWASLILPHTLNIFNMLIVKNYFEGLPESVIESADVDGAGELKTLFQIVLPMSVPVIATVSLLYAIAYWNDYFNVILYINRPSMKTLQVFIRDLIADTATVSEQLERTPETAGLVSAGVITAGVTILGVIPIILAYPFVQRFMIQGITIGSVKG